MAVACARRNVTRGEVHQGDLYDALPAALARRVDLIAVNAPYVPTDAIGLMPPEAREHEHSVALDGGVDGLDLHRRIAADAGEWLRPGGTVVIEVGADQAPASVALFAAAGLRALVVHDDEVDGTCVVAERPV